MVYLCEFYGTYLYWGSDLQHVPSEFWHGCQGFHPYLYAVECWSVFIPQNWLFDMHFVTYCL